MTDVTSTTNTNLIAVPVGDHIEAIHDRRTHQAVPVVITGDDAPMPRASKKELAAARKKAKSFASINEQVQAQMDMDAAKKLAADKLTTMARDPVPRETPPAPDAIPDQAAAKLLADMQRGEANQAPAIPDGGYQGPMRSLRERLKQGAYKKMPNGQPACGDEVATVLGSLEPAEVVRALMIAMDLEGNPYGHLNVGQQSMNLRNKMRGQMKRGELGAGVLREAVEEVLEARPAKPAAQTPEPAPAEPAPAPQAEATPAPAPQAEPAPAPAPAPAKKPSKAKSPRAAQGK